MIKMRIEKKERERVRDLQKIRFISPSRRFFSLLECKNLWSLKHSLRRERDLNNLSILNLPSPSSKGVSWFHSPSRGDGLNFHKIPPCGAAYTQHPQQMSAVPAWWVIGRIVREPLALYYDNRPSFTVSLFSRATTTLFTIRSRFKLK